VAFVGRASSPPTPGVGVGVGAGAACESPLDE
jgi:hypothetical protein